MTGKRQNISGYVRATEKKADRRRTHQDKYAAQKRAENEGCDRDRR